MKSQLAIITNVRMEDKVSDVLERLRVLHRIAIHPGAKKNLKRAMISVQNALQVYQHHNRGMSGCTSRGIRLTRSLIALPFSIRKRNGR